MSKHDEEIKHRNKDSAQHAAFFWIELANQRQGEIIRQLLGLSAILLPLSASVTIAKIDLNQIEKVLLALSWISLIASIFTGFIQIIIDSNYFVKISRDSSKREKLWSQPDKSATQINKEIEALGEVPDSSKIYPLYIQGFTFVVGLILIIAVGTMILFASRSFPNSRLISRHHRVWSKSVK